MLMTMAFELDFRIVAFTARRSRWNCFVLRPRDQGPVKVGESSTGWSPSVAGLTEIAHTVGNHLRLSGSAATDGLAHE